MSDKFETAAATLSDIVARVSAGTLTQGDATPLIATVLTSLWPDHYVQLDLFTSALGRLDGLLWTVGAPSNTLGQEGAAAIDLANRMFYGPKTSSGWGAGKLIFGALLEIPVYLSGQVLPNEVVARLEVSSPVTVAPARCRASAETPPVAGVILNISFGGVNIATVTFGAGQTTGSFSFVASPTSIGPGLLRITAPANPQGLADVSITLSGDR